MPAPIGYTETLRNMLPDSVSATGGVVLVGLQQPTNDGSTGYLVAELDVWWGKGEQKVEHTIEVRIGETFQVEDQTWRLDSTDVGKGGSKPGSYNATITRVA